MKHFINKKNLLFCLVNTVLFFCFLANAAPVNADNNSRGIIRIPARQADGSITDLKLYQGSYALVIGVSEYNNGWPKLPGVIKDVTVVEKVLAEKGFEVTTVLNPDSIRLDNAFQQFIAEHGDQTENRLLFYFSGHGHTLKPAWGGDPIGYIVPVDAPSPVVNVKGFKRQALSMLRIEEYSLDINAKHALFLFDSCFSGSLFSLSRAIPENISYKTARPVRQFITSGADDETVPDKSIFRQQFVTGLQGEADGNKDGFITGSELGSFLQDSVVNYSKGSQHPQYGKIRHPKLDKGDFIFLTNQFPGNITKGESLLIKKQAKRKTAVPVAVAETPDNNTRRDALVKELAKQFQNNTMPGTPPTDSWSRTEGLSLVFMNVKASGFAEAKCDFILGKIRDELRQSGRYRLVERELLDKLLAELRLSNSDLADPATALKLGRILSARLIATGTIIREETDWLASIRFIDTETTMVKSSVSALITAQNTSTMARELSSSIKVELNREFPLQGRIASINNQEGVLDIGSRTGVHQGLIFEFLDKDNLPLGELSVHSVTSDKSYVKLMDMPKSITTGMRVREKVQE